MSRSMTRALAPLAFVVIALASPAVAQMPGVPFKGVLSQASDAALDKLSKPGAFSADSAIRIGLPGQAGALGGVMKMAGQAGMGGGLDTSLNNAAGQAASAAKPIFRAAIDNMSPKDAMSIATGGSTGATAYLQKSAGGQIKTQLTPLIRAALANLGVLDQTSKLSAVGMNEDTLIDYVTEKTRDGIFTYMGREETQLRQNPMSFMHH